MTNRSDSTQETKPAYCCHCQRILAWHSVYQNRCFTGTGEIAGLYGLRSTCFEPAAPPSSSSGEPPAGFQSRIFRGDGVEEHATHSDKLVIPAPSPTPSVSSEPPRLPESVPTSEFSQEFVQGMANRMAVSYFKYGRVAEGYPHKVNALDSLEQRLKKYHQTANTEYLVDAANFCMIEFMHPSVPSAHFTPTDSNGSPGRALNSGKVSSEKNEHIAAARPSGDGQPAQVKEVMPAATENESLIRPTAMQATSQQVEGVAQPASQLGEGPTPRCVRIGCTTCPEHYVASVANGISVAAKPSGPEAEPVEGQQAQGDFVTLDKAISDLNELAAMLREKHQPTGFDGSIALRLDQIAQTLRVIDCDRLAAHPPAEPSLQSSEWRLISKLLQMAHEVFSNHGCNDLYHEFWDEVGMSEAELQSLLKAMQEWNGDKKDPWPQSVDHIQDSSLMHFYADKLAVAPPSREGDR